MTGDIFDAHEAYRLGLVNRLMPHNRLMPEARALAEKLRAKSPVTLPLLKQALDEGYGLPPEAGLAVEAKAWAVALSTEDRAEGVAAFLEKRKAAFTRKVSGVGLRRGNRMKGTFDGYTAC